MSFTCLNRADEGVTEAPRLEKMGREISEKLRRIGGTGTQRTAMRDEALDHIRIAPNREEAFAEVLKSIGMALERSRERGLER